MSTYARLTGTTVGGSGVSGYDPGSIWGGHNPGAYIKAGKSYGANDKWAMDRGIARGFQGAENKGVGSFEEFMNLKKNPNSLFSNIVNKGSPDFVLTQMKFAG